RYVQPNQPVLLRWQVSGNTTGVLIDQGIGAVSATGSRRLLPKGSAIFILTATGPGGTAQASATVNVSGSLPALPPGDTGSPAERQVATELQDLYYANDRSEIAVDDFAIIVRDAAALKTLIGKFPDLKIIIEGHCDERGSAEYNLGLG